MLARARAAGIERLLVPGYDLASSRAAVALAEAEPDLLDAAVGVHPHYAATVPEAGWGELADWPRTNGSWRWGRSAWTSIRNLSPPDAQRGRSPVSSTLAASLGCR